MNSAAIKCENQEAVERQPCSRKVLKRSTRGTAAVSAADLVAQDAEDDHINVAVADQHHQRRDDGIFSSEAPML